METMQKYTVIHMSTNGYGSKAIEYPDYTIIECYPDMLRDMVHEIIGWNNVMWIFDGECKKTEH